MTDPRVLVDVDLTGLPTATFRACVVYLDDVLRECQLVLVAQEQGTPTDPTLSALAAGLVPDIEEVADAFRASEVTTETDGTTHLRGSLSVGQSATLAHLQMQLIQLRLLGRRGGLLLESDPQVTQLLAWIWDELADQLHGREPRRYHAAT